MHVWTILCKTDNITISIIIIIIIKPVHVMKLIVHIVIHIFLICAISVCYLFLHH